MLDDCTLGQAATKSPCGSAASDAPPVAARVARVEQKRVALGRRGRRIEAAPESVACAGCSPGHAKIAHRIGGHAGGISGRAGDLHGGRGTERLV